MRNTAKEAAESNGTGRRFAPTGVRCPMLTVELADKIADNIRNSRLPIGAVAEKFFVPATLFHRWMFDGRKELETLQESDPLSAKAYLAGVVDGANAERIEAMAAHAWESGPKEFSHGFAQWLMGKASSKHLGRLADRDDDRQANLADKAAGAENRVVLVGSLAEKTAEELAELAKG